MAMLSYLDKQDRPEHVGNDSVPAWAVGSPSDVTNMAGVCNLAGKIYAEGRLVMLDRAKACDYFTEAGVCGNADFACVNHGHPIRHLPASPKAEAVISSVLAKLENEASGMTNGQLLFVLGYSYDTGRGHAVDKVKARQFYEKSAALGHPGAGQEELGMMLLAGEGGSRVILRRRRALAAKGGR